MFIMEQDVDPVNGIEFKCSNCDEIVRVEPPGAKYIKGAK